MGYDVDCAGFPCRCVVVRDSLSLFLSGDGCPDYIWIGGSVLLLSGGVSSSLLGLVGVIALFWDGWCVRLV